MDHINKTTHLQLAAECPDSQCATVLGSVIWIWVHFKQFLSTSVSRLARIVDI